MDQAVLDELLATETDRVEWKVSAKDGEGIVEAVCALANDLGATNRPGRVVIGVDKKGQVVGAKGAQESADEVQQRVAGRIYDINLQPTPSVSFDWVHARGSELLVLTVSPYAVPPVVTFKSVARVRVGTTTRKATESDLARLRERRPEASLPFDTRPVVEAGIDDLELDALRRRYESERTAEGADDTFPALEGWLVQRELGRVKSGAFVPNATALLVFGKDPQARFPGAYVDVVRYAGTDVSAAVAARHLVRGTLPDQLDAIWRHFKQEVVQRPAKKQGIVEAFSEDYPFVALEELARNLVQHRAYDITHAPSRVEWFDDRVELTNPGGPFGHASEGEFGALSDYRNPNITKQLVELGYVQKLGRGVRRAQAALRSAGAPPLEVETDGFTRLIVRRAS